MPSETGGIKIVSAGLWVFVPIRGIGEQKGTFVILTGRRMAADTDGWGGLRFHPGAPACVDRGSVVGSHSRQPLDVETRELPLRPAVFSL